MSRDSNSKFHVQADIHFELSMCKGYTSYIFKRRMRPTTYLLISVNKITLTCSDVILDFRFKSMMASTSSKTPQVISFAFKNLKNTGSDKWEAHCQHCDKTITEQRGTTSGFVRYVRSYFYF
jgi:hypothetical protein